MLTSCIFVVLLSFAFVLGDNNWILEPGNDLVLYGPPKLDGHTAVYHKGTNGMLIFGGQTRINTRSVTQSRYFYDFGLSSWINFADNSTTDAPPVRTDHSSVVYGDIMYVYGGVYNSNLYNTLHAYNITAQEWIGPIATTGAPYRFAHAAAVIGDTMYIHGGRDFSEYYNTTHALNLKTFVWSLVAADGPRLERHTMVATPSSELLMFGGYTSTIGYRNTLYLFNGTKWNEVVPEGGSIPAARCIHSSVVIYDGMFVFGGSNNNPFNDLWIFNLTTNMWNLQSPANFSLVSARGGHSAIVTSNNQMIVFGGINNTGAVFNELAIYTPTYQSPTTSTSTSTSATTSSTTSMSSGDSTISTSTTSSATSMSTGDSTTGSATTSTTTSTSTGDSTTSTSTSAATSSTTSMSTGDSTTGSATTDDGTTTTTMDGTTTDGSDEASSSGVVSPIVSFAIVLCFVCFQ